METCDVLVVGGGPAGSTCAWKLRQAGADVLVIDQATFPRDKVCAGWITPPVIDTLQLDTEGYATQRTFQPITAFRTGVIGSLRDVRTGYDTPVSYGIRRCEFDDYLLRRSGARVREGTPVKTIARQNGRWLINGEITADVVVGAGGHFCPIGRLVNGPPPQAALVRAQEAEFRITDQEADSFGIDPTQPELYFSSDLRGYGWCFRKQDFLNIGIGRLGNDPLPKAYAAFIDFLRDRRKVPTSGSWRPRGHAYLLYENRARRVVDDRVVLIGDAAGLAVPQSGEGIRPAIEAGVMAAETLAGAAGDYSAASLGRYEIRLRARASSALKATPAPAIERLSQRLAIWLLGQPWFVRRVVLDRWFLSRHLGSTF
jgi:geranylgeranyl reductase family protein